MPADEFAGWVEFYRLFPFDDAHRYHRPAALLYGQGARNPQQAVDAALRWLAPDPVAENLNDADLRTLAAFGLKPPGR